MTKVKVVTLSKLNSLIKNEEDFSNQQKALLIVKGGLKALGGEEFTEEQVNAVVAVRKAAEEAAATEAAELGLDSLFDQYGDLANAVGNTIEICFSDDSDEDVLDTASPSEDDDDEEVEEEDEEEVEEEESEDDDEEEEVVITKDDDEDDVEEEEGEVGADEESE